MVRPPYHIARQEHLGDALDDLHDRGRLNWRWDYADRRAIYWVALPSQPEHALDTRNAEQLVQRHYDAIGVRWLPVPNPGGEEQRQEILRRITEL